MPIACALNQKYWQIAESMNKKCLPESNGPILTAPVKPEDGTERTFSSYYVHKDTGDIWSCKRGRNLSPTLNYNGYCQTGMIDDEGKLYNVNQQRIVLASKLGHWNYHINRDRKDNRPENLAPVTHKENMDEEARRLQSATTQGVKAPLSKLNDSIVAEILAGAVAADCLKDYKRVMAKQFRVHTAPLVQS